MFVIFIHRDHNDHIRHLHIKQVTIMIENVSLFKETSMQSLEKSN